MGCGKSKHDVVATGNTITRKKSDKEVVANEETSKGIKETTKEETVANINNINTTALEDTLIEEKKQVPSQEEQLQIQCDQNIDDHNVGATAADEKDINVTENNVNDEEIQQGDDQGVNNIGDGHEIVEEKLLEVKNKNDDGLISKDSPDKYFSSGKENDQEYKSEKSEYSSPKEHEAVATEGSLNELADVVAQKETTTLFEETMATTTVVEKTIKEAEIGEAVAEKQEETIQESNPSTYEKEQNLEKTMEETNPSTDGKEQNFEEKLEDPKTT